MTANIQAAFHSFLNLLAGLATIVALAVLAWAVLGWLQWKRRSVLLYRGAELLANLLAAAAGGYVTARISAPMLAVPQTLVLALIVLALAALAALEQRGQSPMLYAVLGVIGAPLAVVGGAWLVLHRI